MYVCLRRTVLSIHQMNTHVLNVLSKHTSSVAAQYPLSLLHNCQGLSYNRVLNWFCCYVSVVHMCNYSLCAPTSMVSPVASHTCHCLHMFGLHFWYASVTACSWHAVIGSLGKNSKVNPLGMPSSTHMHA